jgi:hypothetical protein
MQADHGCKPLIEPKARHYADSMAVTFFHDPAFWVAGIWLVRRIPAARFYPMIYALLMLVGGKLLWDGLRGFMG